jgi:hypothetical protein
VFIIFSRPLKTHGLLLVSAVELPVTKIRAPEAGGLVDASYKESVTIDIKTIIAYDTYTNTTGGLEPVRIGWRRQEVVNAESSTLI